MRKGLIVAAILAVLLVSGAAQASCPVTQMTGEPVTRASKNHYNVCHSAYQVMWDAKTRNPLWVQQWVARDLAQGKVPRGSFKEDPLLPNELRVSDSEYENARNNEGMVLARGHMAPADDFSGSVVAKSESFYLSNAVPQVQKCNNSGVWRTIEDVVRDWGVHHGHVLAVTGPLYERNIGEIGNGIKIPTHIWKVVYNPVRNATVAFIVPNTSLCKAKPHEFVTTQDEVERRTGLKFFPNLSGYARGKVIWP